MIKPEDLAKMTPKEQVDVLVEEAKQLAIQAREAWYADDAMFIGDLLGMSEALNVLIRQYRCLTYGSSE